MKKWVKYILGKIKGFFNRYFGFRFPGIRPIKVPLFEIANNPEIRLTEIKSRRFYIVDRKQIIGNDRRFGRTTVFHKRPNQRETEDEKLFRIISEAHT